MPVLVVQMGHVPRTTGATGTSGGGVTEQDYARAVAAECGRLLTGRDGWVVRPINADVPSGQYRGDAFVAVHCDGSLNTSVHGASVGHQNVEGAALADRWKAAYAARGWTRGFGRDNNTVNLAQYYGVREAIGQGNRRAVIIECGFLTNDEDRAAMVGPGVTRVVLAIGDALGITHHEEEDMACLFNSAPGGDRTILQAINARVSGLVGMDPTTSELGDPAGDYPMPLIDVIDTMSKALVTIGADVAELKARPAADVDEAALASELQAHGGLLTAAEFIAILNRVGLRVGPAA